MTAFPDRILSLEILLSLRASWRNTGRRLVLTNGVFDLLHIGHATYLQEARSLGDLLVVGLNSDASTRALKGPNRPIVLQLERAVLLASLRCVDYVTIFESLTAETLVSTLQPEVYVKGGDYQVGPEALRAGRKRLPEADVVEAYGGQVVLLPYQQGYSTTELVERIIRTAREI